MPQHPMGEPHPLRALRAYVQPAMFALAAAVALILALAIGAQASIARLHDLTDARARARDLRLEIERALSLFKDVEAGARGYALTGRDAFLAPYQSAVQTLAPAYEGMKRRIQAQGLHPDDWAQIDAQVDQRLQASRRIVTARTAHGNDAEPFSGLIAGDLADGRAAMDAIRTRFAELDARQAQHIVDQDLQLRMLRWRARALTWSAAAGAALLMCAGAWLLLRERRARATLAGQLREANRALEERVAARTLELSQARDRAAQYARRLEQGIEDERRRMAREVHDQIGQVFTGLRMILHGLPTGTLGADQERLMHQALDGGIATARRLASELRPPLLDDLGLQAALRHMLDGLLAGSAMHVRVALEDAALLDERQSIGVFRIVQEAASNVLRHAQATRLTIESRRTPTSWRLTISDDGAGFDPARVRRGALGLVGMRERAEMLDAQLSVDSTPGGGSRLSLELPVRTGAADRYP